MVPFDSQSGVFAEDAKLGSGAGLATSISARGKGWTTQCARRAADGRNGGAVANRCLGEGNAAQIFADTLGGANSCLGPGVVEVGGDEGGKVEEDGRRQADAAINAWTGGAKRAKLDDAAINACAAEACGGKETWDEWDFSKHEWEGAKVREDGGEVHSQTPAKGCLGEEKACQKFANPFGRSHSSLDPGAVKFEPELEVGSSEGHLQSDGQGL